ncbi:hypothetical protein V6N13_069858 [Hibiscus sabdariffa]|uniref:Uncharacterized protein n=2 Tax=Hibiscus sabdariffa TaxID=183260 RepID=A0ABR1ZDK2_9ROSI
MTGNAAAFEELELSCNFCLDGRICLSPSEIGVFSSLQRSCVRGKGLILEAFAGLEQCIILQDMPPITCSFCCRRSSRLTANRYIEDLNPFSSPVGLQGRKSPIVP